MRDERMDAVQGTRLRILIADHERGMVGVYEKTLSSSYDLVICHEGVQAIKAVTTALEENRPFSVAFLDIQMLSDAVPGRGMGQGAPVRIGRLDPFMEMVIITEGDTPSAERIVRNLFPNHQPLCIQKPFDTFEIRQFADVLGAKWQEAGRLRHTARTLEKEIAERSEVMAMLEGKLRKEKARRRRSEAVLRECREVFYSFMRHHPGPAFIKNRHGHYIYVNNAYKRTLGSDSTDPIGKRDDEIWPPELAEPMQSGDQMVMSEKRALTSIETIKKGKELLHHLVAKFPIFKNGKPLFTGGTAIDITERIHAERERRILKEKIRSPLRTLIDTSCDMTKVSDMEQQACLTAIHDAVISLKPLIEELIEVSRFQEAGSDFFEIPLLDEALEDKCPPTQTDDPEPEQGFPASLPGLNIREGVRRLDGAWHLYLDLLLFFCDDRKDFAEEFRMVVDEGDFETALISAHALKGSAATISATPLAKAAKELEHACDSRDKDEILDRLGPVEEALAQVIASRELLPGTSTAEDAPASVAKRGQANDLSEVSGWFQKLDKSLRESDPLESETCFREIQEVLTLEDPEMGELFQYLARQTAAYQFEKARETLDSLAKRLDIGLR